MPHVLDHATEIAAVEQDNGSGYEVEGCRAVLLVFEETIEQGAPVGHRHGHARQPRHQIPA